MPKQETTGGILKKLGNAGRASFDENKDKPPEFDTGGDLPEGINGGIAQLVEMKFDLYKNGDNTGKPFFYAAGIVVSPKEHNGVNIQGLRTSITEPLCETPKSTGKRKTVQDHMAHVLNEIKKFQVDLSGLKFDDLEAVVEELKEQRPFFRFRTWKGQKQTTGQYAGKEPRVQHTWNGLVEYSGDDGEAANAVDDETGDDSEAAEPETDETPAEIEGDESGEGDETQPAFDEADLKSLAKQADNPKSKTAGESQKRLAEMAQEAGYTIKEIKGAENWTAVADMIRNPKSAMEEEGSDDEAGEEEGESSEGEGDQDFPYEGATCQYAPLNPKTNKRGKPTQCEILSIDTVKKQATLKDLSTEKTYQKVPLDKIQPIED